MSHQSKNKKKTKHKRVRLSKSKQLELINYAIKNPGESAKNFALIEKIIFFVTEFASMCLLSMCLLGETTVLCIFGHIVSCNYN